MIVNNLFKRLKQLNISKSKLKILDILLNSIKKIQTLAIF